MKIKYISELDPNNPREESYIRDGIKDITNIKKALIASFPGCKGQVIVHAKMASSSVKDKIILSVPLIFLGNGYSTLPLSDNMLIVFRADLDSAKGVKIAINGSTDMNVLDARGEFLDAKAIRNGSVNVLIYYGSTLTLLGHLNLTENKIPPPAETNRNQLLSNNGADFIWFDLPEPPKALPDLTGNEGKALHVIENPVTSILEVSWAAVQEALPPLDGQIGKALVVTEATGSHQLKASWENVEGELPVLTDNQDKFLRVVQTSAGSLGIAWEAVPAVPAELPPIDGKRGLTLQVVLGDDRKEKTEWRSIGRELPDYRSSVDQLLSVVAVGEHMRLAWVDPPSGLPDMAGQKGKALRVVEELETHQLKVAWQVVPEALPAIDGQEGKALLVIKDPTSQRLKVAWENVAGELPDLNGHAGQYLRVMRTDEASLGIGWAAIKENALPEIDASKTGKFLRVKMGSDGRLSLVWRRATPDIDSDDEGRILAVSGGEQTWQDPPQTPPSIALGYF